jgi:hypothetical protein
MTAFQLFALATPATSATTRSGLWDGTRSGLWDGSPRICAEP